MTPEKFPPDDDEILPTNEEIIEKEFEDFPYDPLSDDSTSTGIPDVDEDEEEEDTD